MKKILVTGYPGFLASNLEQKLNQIGSIFVTRRELSCIRYNMNNRNIHYVQCDLLNSSEVWSMLDEAKPDVIIHLAAFADNAAEQEDVYEDNVQMCLNLLKGIKTQDQFPDRVKTRFVLASSSAVYGNGSAWEAEPTEPTSLYGASKLACETLVDVYGKLGIVDGISLRFPAMVGPNMTHGMLKDIIRKVGEPEDKLIVFGRSPGSRKPYLHVDDAIQAILKFGIEGYENSPINVSPHDNITVLDVANMVMVEKGSAKKIVFTEKTWAGDNPYVSMDNDRMRWLGLSLSYPTSVSAIEKAIGEN